MLASLHDEQIYRYFNSHSRAARYRQRECVAPCERLLFDAYIQPCTDMLVIVGLQNISQRCAQTLRRVVNYGKNPAFWRGQGRMVDSENLMLYLFCLPGKAIAELARSEFRFIALQGYDYPLKRHLLSTNWYYDMCRG